MIRAAHAEELALLREIALAAFEREVAPLLGEEGRAEYERFTQPQAMEERVRSGNEFFVWVADDAIRAMSELRERNHLVMLFADPSAQGQGLGRALLEHALQLGVETVSSSPNAVGFYAQHGFQPTCEEQQKNGLRFVPMRVAGER